MKLKFKNQNFQTAAVDAVADLFIGQEKRYHSFVLDEHQRSFNQFGVGNPLLINDDTMLANLHTIQKRHNLPLSEELSERQFCVEMETGTGKTYVYTKTIFELNKRYGFTKFIIVVPSVAIREGVLKSLQITEEHFGLAYNNVPRHYFVYDSKRLNDVRQFATAADIEIMIINIDAFKKSENIINQRQDSLNGETAMRYIQDTNPIVIIDEPQSVDNTPKAKEAIASLNPLCVLRYSATHRQKLNLVYRLTPVDAYQMGLVKQICVSSNQIVGSFSKPYVRLVSVSNENGFRAKIELDRRDKNGAVSRKQITIKPSDDLFVLSGERDLYRGYKVEGIDCTPGQESLEFANAEFVKLGVALGDIDENIIKRAQIKRTIEAHLEKELLYFEHGIKVLSLFFIDEVKKYRTGEGDKGLYAHMFEECYQELLQLPKFALLKVRFQRDVDTVHNGYFSQDKKGHYKNTKGDTVDDYDTYNTIMRDKEWLLSYDCPLRFIFSHSALKEGWDNPNVFQVCTLIEQKTAFTCRQKVGRGLRLCVNQSGERIEDKNINILHVMANESFAEFAETLQKEIETETGVKFGILEIGLFAGITYTQETKTEHSISQETAQKVIEQLETKGLVNQQGQAVPELTKAVESGELTLPAELAPFVPVVQQVIRQHGQAVPLKAESLTAQTYTVTVTEEKTVTYDDAQELLNHLEAKNYITKDGKITNTMKQALKDGTLDLPAKFEAARDLVVSIISQADKRPPIRDAANEVTVKLKKQAFASPEFLKLWDKIKHKTAYRVKVDSGKLVNDCVKTLQEMPFIPKPRIVTKQAILNIENPGVSVEENKSPKSMEIAADQTLPDILLILQEECGVPQTLCNEILLKSGRLQDFLNNPQQFIENCIFIIKKTLQHLEIDGISYTKLAGKEYYLQEIFADEELRAYLDSNAVAVSNSLYDHIIYDSSTIERPFAVALDKDPDVKFFLKLPVKFKIDTPIGSYNPDWAVYMDKDGMQKMYFVIETKGSLDADDLRIREKMKIDCGNKHFEALNNDVEFYQAKNWQSFKMQV